MIFSTNIDGGTVTLNITGELDAVSVPDLRPVLDDLISKGHKKIVVDLKGLRLIDSSGVGAIVYLFRRVRGPGRHGRGAGGQRSAAGHLAPAEARSDPDRQRAALARVRPRRPGKMPCARVVAGASAAQCWSGCGRNTSTSGCRATCATRPRGCWPRARGPAPPAVRLLRSLRAALEAAHRRGGARAGASAGPRATRAMAAGFRDADGRPPRHSFFFPGEEYAPEYLAGLAELAQARAGRGGAAPAPRQRHRRRRCGGRSPATWACSPSTATSAARTARLRYAFIHGNWCLANARSDGRWCGVDAELPLLFETGCYADFTFPAAPDESQPGVVNRIYWPDGDLHRRRAYEQGPARAGGRDLPRPHADDRGPAVAARARPPRRFLRIENADITGANPATPRARAQLGRPEHPRAGPPRVGLRQGAHPRRPGGPRRRPAGRRRPAACTRRWPPTTTTASAGPCTT